MKVGKMRWDALGSVAESLVKAAQSAIIRPLSLSETHVTAEHAK